LLDRRVHELVVFVPLMVALRQLCVRGHDLRGFVRRRRRRTREKSCPRTHAAGADLPTQRIAHDNRTFRLGDELAVRLPSAAGYAAAVATEQRWLPVIARTVPLPVPEPLGQGAPDADYPFPWSVNRWLPGESALTAPVPDQHRFARDLAAFLRALQTVETDEDA
jgi:aminoglycoside phosphotransferase (APT) family kinase protein